MIFRVIALSLPPFLASSTFSLYDVYIRENEQSDEKACRVTLQEGDKKKWGEEASNEDVVKAAVKFFIAHKSLEEMPDRFDADIVKNFEGADDAIIALVQLES
jgi:hypothetical protein